MKYYKVQEYNVRPLEGNVNFKTSYQYEKNSRTDYLFLIQICKWTSQERVMCPVLITATEHGVKICIVDAAW